MKGSWTAAPLQANPRRRQVGYKRAGLPGKTNSAAAYGSVMHHAILQVLERQLAQGTPFDQALRMALDTFAHYCGSVVRR